MKTPTKVIKAAITRVIKKINSGWTKCTFARDKSGNSVDANDPTAVRWCALGAMASTIRDDKIYREVFRLVNTSDGIMRYNDNASKKSDVIKLFQGVYDSL